MLSPKNNQCNLSDVDKWYELIPKNSIWHHINKLVARNVSDYDFVHLFSANKGRSSIPPSLTFGSLIVMIAMGYSYREMAENAMFDDRVKFALGLSRIPEYSLNKSTLCRHHKLFLNDDKSRAIMRKIIVYALKMIIVLKDSDKGIVDSMMVNGAVSKEDTCALLKNAIEVIIKTAEEDDTLSHLQEMLTYEEYFLKGNLKPGGKSEEENNRTIASLIEDARKLKEYLTGPIRLSAELKCSLELFNLVVEQGECLY